MSIRRFVTIVLFGSADALCGALVRYGKTSCQTMIECSTFLRHALNAIRCARWKFECCRFPQLILFFIPHQDGNDELRVGCLFDANLFDVTQDIKEQKTSSVICDTTCALEHRDETDGHCIWRLRCCCRSLTHIAPKQARDLVTNAQVQSIVHRLCETMRTVYNIIYWCPHGSVGLQSSWMSRVFRKINWWETTTRVTNTLRLL